MSITDCIALGTALIAVFALIWQIRANINQSKMQTFLIYTQRYQDILINLPIGVESKEFNLNRDDKNYEIILRWLRAYFDLCSEEYYLNKKNLVNKSAWELWEGEW